MNIFLLQFIFPKFFFQYFFPNFFFKIVLHIFFQHLKIFFPKIFSNNFLPTFFQNLFFEGFTLGVLPVYRDKTDSMYLCYEKYDKQNVEIGL